MRWVEIEIEIDMSPAIQRHSSPSPDLFPPRHSAALGSALFHFSDCHPPPVADPASIFAQNNGVIALTRCANRKAGYVCASFLILYGGEWREARRGCPRSLRR